LTSAIKLNEKVQTLLSCNFSILTSAISEQGGHGEHNQFVDGLGEKKETS